MPNQPHPNRTKVAFLIPKEVKSALRQIAARRHTDFSKLCNEILADWVAKYPKPKR